MPSQVKSAQSSGNSRAAEPTLVAEDCLRAEKPESEPAEDEQRLMRRNALAKYGFNPKSDGRFPITSELVDRIREESGL